MGQAITRHTKASEDSSAEGRISNVDKLRRFVVIVLLTPLIYVFVREAILFVATNADVNRLRYFLIGFIAYVAIHLAVWGKGPRLSFLHTFEHELGHLLVGLASGKGIDEFLAKQGEGYVKLEENGSFLFFLAPYFLPVFAIPFLLLRPFAPTSIERIINFLIGATLGFHYAGLLGDEFRPSQPDLKKMGWWFSVGIVLLMNAVILVIALAMVLGKNNGIIEYLQSAGAGTVEAYRAVFYAARNADVEYVLSQLR